MKGVDIFCASQASTAVCLTMDPGNGTSSTVQLGGRAIDRHNPIITDERRIGRAVPTPPCSSQQSPITSKSSPQLPKGQKGSLNSKEQGKKSSKDQKKKKSRSTELSYGDVVKKSVFNPTEIISRTCVNSGALVTPPGSSRYLLSDTAYFDGLTDPDTGLESPAESKTTISVNQDKSLVINQGKPVDEPKKIQALDKPESNGKNPSSSFRSGSSSSNQVVVLRVSLHCRGCEGKVRRHLSKMKGVTSFNTDFAAKKVTVVGDVTPLSVLASVSKVKTAQFWTPTSAANKESRV